MRICCHHADCHAANSTDGGRARNLTATVTTAAAAIVVTIASTTAIIVGVTDIVIDRGILLVLQLLFGLFVVLLQSIRFVVLGLFLGLLVCIVFVVVGLLVCGT